MKCPTCGAIRADNGPVPGDAVELDGKVRRFLGVSPGESIAARCASILASNPGAVGQRDVAIAHLILSANDAGPWEILREAARIAERGGV